MKLKTIIILIAIAALLIIFYTIQQGRRGDSAAANRGGELVPANFNSDQLATVKLEGNNKTVTLTRTDKGWAVAERYNYPANTDQLRELFIKLCNTRIAQTLSLLPTQLEELGLTPETSTILTLTGKDQKELKRISFGSIHNSNRNAQMPYNFGGGNGRYLQLANGQNVLVSERFDEINTDVTSWLNRDFYQITNLKRVGLQRNGKTEWVLEFKDGKPVLAGFTPADKELDEGKITNIKSTFSYIRFTDVAAPESTSKVFDSQQVSTLVLLDEDDLVYTLKLANDADKHYYLRVSAAWKGKTERPAADNEKPEDKSKLDQEFAETVKARQNKAQELEKKLANWTYEVEKSVFDAIAGTRDDLLKAKAKPEDKSSSENPKDK